MKNKDYYTKMSNPTGELDLTFRKKQSGKTYIAEQYYDLPLQVLPPYYQDEDGTAFAYLLNLTGGVLQGDRLLTKVNLEKNSKALIATPSANRFYKMEDDHAELLNIFKVGENAVLEYIPDYNIPYSMSDVYQDSIFMLKESSTLITWDMVIPGRVDRGEKFDYKCYSSKIKIFVEDKLEAFEYSKLTSEKEKMLSLGILENYNIYATVFIYKKELPKDLKVEIEKTWKPYKEIKGGVSLINDSLTSIKILGNSVFEMEEVLMKIWEVFRKNLLGKDKVRIRKY